MIDNNNLLLYSFFESLRKDGFPLGLDDYYSFIEVLQSGYKLDKKTGTFSKNQIYQICKTLWLKPNQIEFRFNQLFEERFFDFEKIEHKSEETPKSEEIPKSEETPKSENPKIEPHNEPSEDKLEKWQKDEIKKQQGNEIKEDDFSEIVDQLVKMIVGKPNKEVLDVENLESTSIKNFIFSNNYFYVTPRQLQQTWRFLPTFAKANQNEELDIDIIIEQFARKDYSLPSYERNKKVINNVVVLTDHNGSMLAFDTLSEMIVKSISNVFELKENDMLARYYFYNVPHEYIYENEEHTKYQKMSNLLDEIRRDKSYIVIISDAGAARGSNSDERFIATVRFLQKLKRVTNKIVWLNPMPKKRWINTSAEKIERFLPNRKMIEMSTIDAFQEAIKILKGKI